MSRAKGTELVGAGRVVLARGRSDRGAQLLERPARLLAGTAPLHGVGPRGCDHGSSGLCCGRSWGAGVSVAASPQSAPQTGRPRPCLPPALVLPHAAHVRLPLPRVAPVRPRGPRHAVRVQAVHAGGGVPGLLLAARGAMVGSPCPALPVPAAPTAFRQARPGPCACTRLRLTLQPAEQRRAQLLQPLKVQMRRHHVLCPSAVFLPFTKFCAPPETCGPCVLFPSPLQEPSCLFSATPSATSFPPVLKTKLSFPSLRGRKASLKALPSAPVWPSALS